MNASLAVVPSGSAPLAESTVANRAVGTVVRLVLAALMLLPVFGFLESPSSLAAKLLVCGLFCITLRRPEDGLLVCAAFLPFAVAPTLLLGAVTSVREPLLLAFLAGFVLRETVRPPAPIDRAGRSLLRPALLLAAVVAASVVVQLAVEQVRTDYPWPYVRHTIWYLANDFVLVRPFQPGLPAGAVVLESLGLFAAALVLGLRHPDAGRRTLAMAAVGGMGVAAMNVYRLLSLSVRTGAGWNIFQSSLRTIRVNTLFPDLNAGGSYLALILLLCAGFAVSNRRWRLAWAAASLVVLVGLWFTGSRAALAAAPLAGTALAAWVVLGRGRLAARTLVVVVAAVTVVLLIGWALQPVFVGRSIDVATRSRIGLLRAGVKMTAAHPLFGVGVGRFLPESAAFIDPAFARDYYPRENAHNNFLQVLAELGVAGFVPFLWLLGACATRVRAALADGRDPILGGAAAGVLAFLLTCLLGHPLLIPEVANGFWLVLGATAALALSRAAPAPDDARPAGAARRWYRRPVAAAIVCLVVSIPPRAHAFIANEADLTGAAHGFTAWREEGGIRFRTFTGQAEFYVPADVCDVRVPLRTDADGKAPIEVEIRLDGDRASVVRVGADDWLEARLRLPLGSRRRFRKVEMRTVPEGVTLRSGRPRMGDCFRNPS